jgi:murein tripeptide amidase MpaA
MKGIIEYLAQSNTDEALQLRSSFVFKIVPMINVDGVIFGNYRCSLSGFDLNRVWKKPDEKLFPEVYSIKRMVEAFH